MQTLALVGAGAIGRAVLALLKHDATVCVTQLIVRGPAPSAVGFGGRDDGRADAPDEAMHDLPALAPRARRLGTLDLSLGARPDLLVECAGHAALTEHVLPALRAGVPAIVASIGALHDATLAQRLEDAAREGGTRLTLVCGAIGGIDALAAARIGGLHAVRYTGRKPPRGWLGTPAEQQHDLAALREPVVIFDGSAREAARLYPKNANVAATVSLAGLGLDATRATLIADPGVQRNVHRIEAEGAFGRLDLTMENEPLAANPKTSALTVYSVVRAIHNATRALAI